VRPKGIKKILILFMKPYETHYHFINTQNYKEFLYYQNYLTKKLKIYSLVLPSKAIGSSIETVLPRILSSNSFEPLVLHELTLNNGLVTHPP